MRHLKDQFLKEFFKGGQFYEIIKMVKTDPSLDVELRGNSVMIYYRGGKLLTINDPYKNDQEDLLKELDKQYVSPTRKGLINPIAVPKPTIDNMEAYICKGKRAIDWYEENVARKLGEKEIQQRVAYENNFSVNAEDTAIGFGWTKIETKSGKKYTSIRCDRMNGFILDMGFRPQVGEICGNDSLCHILESFFGRIFGISYKMVKRIFA